jgi:hypothetical protein
LNTWFDRFRDSLMTELHSNDPTASQIATLSPDEARALLDLTRDVAQSSGARQYAPMVAYLAGRLAQSRIAAGETNPAELIAAVARAAQAAGPAGEETR